MSRKKFKHCDECGIEFHPKSPRKSARYCSRICAAKAVSRTRPKTTSSTSFKRGNTPWNKGLAGWNAGHEVSVETRLAISRSLLANGRQRVTPEHERIRKSTAYALWRKSVFERDGYRCVHCGAKSCVGTRVILHADHIKPFSTHPELRLDKCNGRTLCVECHKKTPTYAVQRTKLTGQKAELSQ